MNLLDWLNDCRQRWLPMLLLRRFTSSRKLALARRGSRELFRLPVLGNMVQVALILRGKIFPLFCFFGQTSCLGSRSDPARWGLPLLLVRSAGESAIIFWSERRTTVYPFPADYSFRTRGAAPFWSGLRTWIGCAVFARGCAVQAECSDFGGTGLGRQAVSEFDLDAERDDGLGSHHSTC